ncbi:MAG: selenide, water dikinase SelD [Planctomycetota bacterium]|nr:selenide, water dikinase SelD [Planctomycetota bacterium]
MALVQTVDVMTPCVDDPEAFGRICAANCLSDIYAMGARPLTALSILGFPSETLDGTIMYLMLRGAMAVFAQAGVALIGGHSVKDEEIKLGFAITGTVAPEAAVHRGRAAVGDCLVLTKPLGTGVVGFCRQIGRTDGLDIAAAERAMMTLNRDAAEAMTAAGASAATDITGFGLFGHLIGMARHSGATVRIFADALPAFGGVLEALRAGVIPGAIERNSEYLADDIAVADGVDPSRVLLGFDAQTSGGMLIAISPGRAEALRADLARRGAGACLIGRVVEASEGRIEVVSTDQNAPAARRPEETTDMPNDKPAEKQTPACCGDAAGSPAAQAFRALMGATAADGAVDAKTKELITFALVVMARCGPCIRAHLKKAAKMGISQAQLDEAAWLAVAIGGAPVKMFYDECLEDHAKAGPCCS